MSRNVYLFRLWNRCTPREEKAHVCIILSVNPLIFSMLEVNYVYTRER